MSAASVALCLLALFAYGASRRIARLPIPRALRPFASPVLLGAALLYAACVALRIPPALFAPVTHLCAALLVPATMALAPSVFRGRAAVGRHAALATLALVGGSSAGIATAFALAHFFALDSAFAGVLSIKSATAAVSLDIANRHGFDSLATSAIVVGTGVFGAAFGPGILAACRVSDPIARGLAYGATSHAIGTARAIGEGELTGAVAGVALCANAVFVALAGPLALWFVLGR